MSSDIWKSVKLGTICNIKGRIGWKGYTKSDLRDFGPIVLGGNNIKNGLYLDLNEIKHLSQEKYNESPEIMLKPDNILVVTRGNGIGDIAYYVGGQNEVTINPSMVILSDIRVNPRYLFYYLISPKGKKRILSISSGSSIPAIYQQSLATIDCDIPPSEKQKAIAATLSCLDEKIELNNKINANLEAQVQAIFKSWFVDFEPFQDGEFEDSELGQIPRGWRVTALGEVCDYVTKGTTPTTIKKGFSGRGINFIKVESILDNHTFDISRISFIDEDTDQLLRRSRIKQNDILFTMAGTIGRFAFVDKSILPANTNQAVAIIRPNVQTISPFVLYSFFIAGWHLDYFHKNIQQAVQANLSLGSIKSLPIIMPPLIITQKYEEIITPLISLIISNNKQNSDLRQIRDTLLPKLISGEIELSK